MLPVFHISRLRMRTDGDGVTTLVGVSGCPNRCYYCINCAWLLEKPKMLTAQALYDLVSVDDIYFRATNGGITFGGGEPLLWPDGIVEFSSLVDNKWRIRVETSLNVPWEHVEKVLPYVDTFLVDIKDMNETIYHAYTQASGAPMRANLARLATLAPEKVQVRIPTIPDFNTKADVAQSKLAVEQLGIRSIQLFTYQPRKAPWPTTPEGS